MKKSTHRRGVGVQAAPPPVTNGSTPPPPSVNGEEKWRELLAGNAAADTVFARTSILRQLIDPKRDIDSECGYPAQITIEVYSFLYDRGDIAARVVDILPSESWKKFPEITSTQAGEETEFEKQLKVITAEHNIFARLKELDVTSGIGRFGVMILGLNDGKELDQPVEGVGPDGKATGKSPGGERKLLYIRVFDESCVKVDTYDQNPASPRFDQPVLYSIQFNQQDGRSSFTKKVHWTRVIHVADNRRNSEVYGRPRMELVFNRLYDLKKLCGGAGEMFWKGGFPGYGIKIDPALLKDGVPVTVNKTEIKAEMEAYFNQLQRYFMLEGLTVESLSPQVADPTNHFKMFLTAICVALGVPLRIFMGTEEAQLAGEQDSRAWRDRLTHRIEQHVEPYIVRPLINRLMAFGVLKQVDEYFVNWPDLFALSEKDRAEVMAKMVDALVKYLAGGVAEAGLIAPLEFLTHVCNFEQEAAEEILARAEQYLEEHIDELEEGEEEPPPLEDRAREAEEMEAAKARGRTRGRSEAGGGSGGE